MEDYYSKSPIVLYGATVCDTPMGVSQTDTVTLAMRTNAPTLRPPPAYIIYDAPPGLCDVGLLAATAAVTLIGTMLAASPPLIPPRCTRSSTHVRVGRSNMSDAHIFVGVPDVADSGDADLLL
jgi:hypothetical protein